MGKVGALCWVGLKLELKTLERGVAHHMGKGMMMEIIHFLMPSFSLSLSLCGYYGLNQEQGKQTPVMGIGRGRGGVVFRSVCINNAYHYKAFCAISCFSVTVLFPIPTLDWIIGFNALTVLTAFHRSYHLPIT